MNVTFKVSHRELTLPKGYFKDIPIEEKDINQGITSKFLKEAWKIVNEYLVEGTDKNLWVILPN